MPSSRPQPWRRFDVVVIGAGPAGLCFALSLERAGVAVAIVERQQLDRLEHPAFDGREIALTDASHRLATLPLYLATNGIVELYTSESLPMRFARDAILRLSDRATPLKAALAAFLTRGAAEAEGFAEADG